MEAVYDEKGDLVTDPLNAGTYNFASPYQEELHLKYDVIPYLLWGNNSQDSSTFSDRIGVSIKALILREISKIMYL